MRNADEGGATVIPLSTKNSFLEKLPEIIRHRDELLRLREERKIKHGRGSWVRAPKVKIEDWRRDYDHRHLARLLLRNRASFSITEISVLMFLAVSQPGRDRLHRRGIAEGLNLDLANARRSISRLVQCGMIVDIGHGRNVNLALNCNVSGWDIGRLPALRKAYLAKKRGRSTVTVV